MKKLSAAIEREKDVEKRCKARMHLVKMDEHHQKGKKALDGARQHLTGGGIHGLGITVPQAAIYTAIALIGLTVVCKGLFAEECRMAWAVLQWTIAGVVILAGVVGVGLLGWGLVKRIQEGTKSRERAWRTKTQEQRRKARESAARREKMEKFERDQAADRRQFEEMMRMREAQEYGG
jgi:hypothetical protein